MRSTTKAKNNVLVLLVSLLTLSSWSCERTALPQSDMVEQALPQMLAVPECPIGTMATFGLDVHYGNHYRIEIPDPPSFNFIDDCMCNMKYIQLNFDFLPDATDIFVYDEFGNDVPFSGPSSGPQGPYLRVYADDLLPLVLVEFDPATGETPQLVSEGGFCLIDNLSGPYPPGDNIHNEPYLRVDPNSFKNEMWLPSIMTTPY